MQINKISFSGLIQDLHSALHIPYLLGFGVKYGTSLEQLPSFPQGCMSSSFMPHFTELHRVLGPEHKGPALRERGLERFSNV